MIWRSNPTGNGFIFQVFRRDSRKLPIGDRDVDWEETIYLNLIVHQVFLFALLLLYLDLGSHSVMGKKDWQKS